MHRRRRPASRRRPLPSWPRRSLFERPRASTQPPSHRRRTSGSRTRRRRRTAPSPRACPRRPPPRAIPRRAASRRSAPARTRRAPIIRVTVQGQQCACRRRPLAFGARKGRDSMSRFEIRQASAVVIVQPRARAALFVRESRVRRRPAAHWPPDGARRREAPHVSPASFVWSGFRGHRRHRPLPVLRRLGLLRGREPAAGSPAGSAGASGTAGTSGGAGTTGNAGTSGGAEHRRGRRPQQIGLGSWRRRHLKGAANGRLEAPPLERGSNVAGWRRRHLKGAANGEVETPPAGLGAAARQV